MDLDNLSKLVALASNLKLPDLAAKGAVIARSAAAYAAEVKANVERGKHVLAAGDRAELDAIHAEALAAADQLDAKLAAAAAR